MSTSQNVYFSTGHLYIVDSSGQPHKIGALQNVEVSDDRSLKDVKGGKELPLAVFVTGRKITGKAESLLVDGGAIAAILSGTVTAGRIEFVDNKVYATLGTTGTISVSPTGTGMALDRGVLDANGGQMTVTASAPNVGSYTVSTGTGGYSFNATETGNVSISWGYNTGSGQTVTLANPDLAAPQFFELVLHLPQSNNGKTLGVRYKNVVIPKLSLAAKLEDAVAESVDFDVYPDSTGAPGYLFYV